MNFKSIYFRLASLDYMVASEGIGLVIVDSIASLIRKEYDTRYVKGLSDRSCYLAKQANLLKYVYYHGIVVMLYHLRRLAQDYNIIVR